MTKFTPQDPELISNAEDIRGLYNMIEALVEYEPCDCGCPWKRSPKTKRDVDLVRVLSYMRCYLGVETST